MSPSPWLRWFMGSGIALLLLVVPFVHYRAAYETHKRLRTVSTGKVLRSGCMNAAGFRDAIRKYGIRLVINLQEEARDPALPCSYFSSSSIHESELCRELGVRYEFLEVELVPPHVLPMKKPG